MLWINIKNTVKLTLRSKFILILMLVSPLVIIGAVSSAFDSLLEGSYKSENLIIGYETKDNSPLNQFFNESGEFFRENKLELKKMDAETGKKMVAEKSVDIFIEEQDTGTVIYSTSRDSIATEMGQYVLKQFYDEYHNEVRKMTMVSLEKTPVVDIVKGKLEGVKLAESDDYYAIIEVVYFIFVGVVFLTYSIASERKNNIAKRLIATPANPFMLYFSKYIPCVVLTLLSQGIVAVLTCFIFGAKWGNIPGTIAILTLETLGATALGMVFVYFVKNLAVSVVVIFTVSWFAGFIGGSFETYMFSAIPESVKVLSPIYHVNRTLVEYSTMGHSSYTTSCIIYMLVLMVVCILLGTWLMKRQMEVE